MDEAKLEKPILKKGVTKSEKNHPVRGVDVTVFYSLTKILTRFGLKSLVTGVPSFSTLTLSPGS
jgi:hypothetical protein